MRIVRAPAGIDAAMFHRGQDTFVLDNLTEAQFEEMGCLVKRLGNAYSWHRCGRHDAVVVWAGWDGQDNESGLYE